MKLNGLRLCFDECCAGPGEFLSVSLVYYAILREHASRKEDFISRIGGVDCILYALSVIDHDDPSVGEGGSDD